MYIYMLKYMEPGKPGQMKFQYAWFIYYAGSRICRQHQQQQQIVEILNCQILPPFCKSMIHLVRTIAVAKDKSTATNVTKQKATPARSNKAKGKAIGFLGGVSRPFSTRISNTYQSCISYLRIVCVFPVFPTDVGFENIMKQ